MDQLEPLAHKNHILLMALIMWKWNFKQILYIVKRLVKE